MSKDVPRSAAPASCFLMLALLLASPSPAAAQSTSTWTGLGANSLWNTPANWQGSTLPVSSSSTALNFTGSTQNNLVLNVAKVDLNSLTFASEAGPFTINQTGTEFFNFLAAPGSAALPHIDQFSANPQVINFPNLGLQLNGDLLLGGAGSGSLTINGQVSAIGGIGRLILNGPYTVVLNNPVANIFSGVIINAGTLRIAADSALGNGPLSFGGGILQLSANVPLTRALILNPGGGTIDAHGFTATIANAGLTVTGPGRLTLTNSSGTGASSITAQLQQTGGLTVTGVNNTVTLAGANTYTSGTTVSNAAILNIDSDARLGNASSAVTLDDGTIRLTSASGYNSNRPITLAPGGGALEVLNSTAAIGFTGPISGSGGLTKSGPGHIGLLAANSYSGPTTLTAGFLDILHNQAAQNSTISLNGGTLGFALPASAPVLGGLAGNTSLALSGINGLSIGNNNASTTYSGNLSGSLPGGLNKIGAGVWTLAGTNTQSGPFNIQAGTVVAASPGALSQSALINLSPGAILDLNGFSCIPAVSPINIGGTLLMRFGAISPTPGIVVTYNGASVSNGFLAGTGRHVITGPTTFTNVTTFNGSRLSQDPGATLNLINSTIGGELVNGGSVLNWTNGILSSSGVLTVLNTTNVTGFENQGVIFIESGGTLNDSSTPLISAAGARITVNGGLLNAGPGFELNGSLLVNNGTVTGTTKVNYGSLAKGSGTYGQVNITDGGKFSPGNSPGSVTTGSTTWNSGGSYIVEIADALAGSGIGWDIWNINGNLTLNASNTTNGRFTISLASLTGDSPGPASNFDSQHDSDWIILHTTDGITNFDASAISLDTSGFKNNLSGGHFSIISDQNNLSVHFTSVPEPALSLGILGILAACSRFGKRLQQRERI
jgi:fibronectin-binding autotransporter adhesin